MNNYMKIIMVRNSIFITANISNNNFIVPSRKNCKSWYGNI